MAGGFALMYTINANSFPIYDQRTDVYVARNAKATISVNEPDELTFRVDYDHPNLSRLSPLSATVELKQDTDVLLRGRIINDTIDTDLTHSIIVEGALGWLNDSIIEPFNFPDDFLSDPAYQSAAVSGNVVEYFLRWIISRHNAQTNAERRLTLGTVTVADPNNYLARSSTEYNTAWETVRTKLFESTLGGYLVVRYDSIYTYIDYLSAFPTVINQSVEFGENLLKVSNELDATETYSVILPIGSDGLTIAALPDRDLTTDLVKQGSTIYSRRLAAEFGRVVRCVKWDDVTLIGNLRDKAMTALSSQGIAQTLTVNAVDLHATGDNIDPFRVGNKVIFESAPHGFNNPTTYPILTLEIDLADPSQTQITLQRTSTSQSTLYSRLKGSK